MPVLHTEAPPVRTFADAMPSSAVVAKNSRNVTGEFHAGRPGARYRRALAPTPATPNRTVKAPAGNASGNSIKSAIEYTVAATANRVKSSTSRLNHERRHIFNARAA